jgi:hypothetical protein
MHYHAEVWIKENEDYESDVNSVLEPFDSNHNRMTGGLWDWFQIGGRWSGTHAKGYEPDKDPKNQEKCELCDGTGTRPGGLKDFGADWVKSVNGCNGCHGTGTAVKWPTQWKPMEKDVIAVTEIDSELDCHVLFIQDKNGDFPRYYEVEKWDGENFVKTEFDGNVKKQLEKLGIKDGYLVTVDLHN